tara:strand:+ start:939 stop:1334 length:396 start_codon:yes stop_codon:yes gene_type:complete
LVGNFKVQSQVLVFRDEVQKLERIEFKDFLKVDMRVGEVVRAEPFTKAIKPAIKLWIQFGEEIGLRQSSAQITDNYSVENLPGKKVVAVVNLKPRRIASFKSEVLILGVLTSRGITLLIPEKDVKVGERVH